RKKVYEEITRDSHERCGPYQCICPSVACCPSGYRSNQAGSCAHQSTSAILSICDASAVPGTGAERDGDHDETGWEGNDPSAWHRAYPFPHCAGGTDPGDHSSSRDLRQSRRLPTPEAVCPKPHVEPPRCTVFLLSPSSTACSHTRPALDKDRS